MTIPLKLFRRIDAPAHAIIRHEAELAGFQVVDLLDPLLAYGLEKIDLDGVHPNPDGHRLLASLLADRVLEIAGLPASPRRK